MSPNERGKYSAASSSLGYFYQCRYALLEALRRLSEGERVSIGIETLDDVVFDRTGSPLEILQTKHHTNSHVSLADASPDLWRSLRIWIEGQADGTIPPDARFFLITTGICSAGSAASYLRPDERDEQEALRRLNATAATSTNESNASAYKAFCSLSEDSRVSLVKAMVVLDASPSIGELDDLLRQVIYYAVERRFLDSYLQRLEGWWYDQVVKHLRNERVTPILGEELEAESCRIREQFKVDNLPVHDDIMHATIDASGYMTRPFVEQLGLIGVNQNRILHAIKNYYRAFEHRSRWLREELLYVGDLERYEERLIEEWDVMFEQMRDELGADAADEAKTRAAQGLYKWVETGAHQSIRPAVSEPAIARGTYQMLADDLRVGWHVEFRERLRAILSDTGGSQ